MKTTTTLIAFLGLFRLVVFAQHSHELDELFHDRTLRDFETEVQVNDYSDQGLIDYVDNAYQVFFQDVSDRITNGDSISHSLLDAEYQQLVSDVKDDITNRSITVGQQCYTKTGRQFSRIYSRKSDRM